MYFSSVNKYYNSKKLLLYHVDEFISSFMSGSKCADFGKIITEMHR